MMDRLLGTYTPYLYALMRIVLGVLFACHGAQKLFGVLGGEPVALFSLSGLAGIIEFVGGLLVAVGFLTSYAAFIASGEMAVAYFMAMSRAVSGRYKTAGNSPCCTALSFSISPHEAWAPGVSTRCATPLKRNTMPGKATASQNGRVGGG
jgi:hypothetical protein